MNTKFRTHYDNLNVARNADTTVIWWDKGQASIIKINDIYVAGGMLFNTNGIDQNGRQWQISDNSYGFCY